MYSWTHQYKKAFDSLYNTYCAVELEKTIDAQRKLLLVNLNHRMILRVFV
jgi:hypothetical protein